MINQATTSEKDVPACSVIDLRKTYGGVRALRGVSIDFHPGKVHAILGENGAGKSTLMKILAGAETPDAGSIALNGVTAHYNTVTSANAAGVAIVFQELSLFPDLDILANLFANRQPHKWGAVDRATMRRAAIPVLRELGLTTKTDTIAGDLALHDRQLLEIAKALLIDTRVLILDEPTSSLSANEVERLFSVVRTLRSRGVAILLVSHRLEEISAIADTVTVLRNGEWVKTVPMAETTMTQLVTDMIGRAPTELPSLTAPPRDRDTPRLRLDGVCTSILKDITLDVQQGEVLGLAGLEDAGVQELMYTIVGLAKPTSGAITMPDGTPAPTRPTDAVRRGMALVPADRRKDGLMLDDSILTNFSSVKAGVTRGYGFRLSTRKLRKAAIASGAQLKVKYHSVGDAARSLSGGNQQKIVLGKWLQIEPSIVLLDDPTRGVDLGAKLEIYEVIRALAGRGCIILFNSSELEEYSHLCQRVAVLRRGQVRTVLSGDEIDQHRLLHTMNQ
jgi:ABC-type sugar transport system ATPase subunit